MYYAKKKGHTIKFKEEDIDNTFSIINISEEQQDENNFQDNINEDIIEFKLDKEVYKSRLIDDETYNKLTEKINNNTATKIDKYEIEKYIHYKAWLLPENINEEDFKLYFHKLNILKSYKIYDNIEKFRKILKIFNIEEDDEHFFDNFPKVLYNDKYIKQEAEEKKQNIKISKQPNKKRNILKIEKDLEKDLIKFQTNMKKICEILNTNLQNIKHKIYDLFWKMGYNLNYGKTGNHKETDFFRLKLHDTLYKKEFARDIIISRIEYMDKICKIMNINNVGDAFSNIHLESKISSVNKIIKEDKFKILFESQVNNIKSIKGLIGVLNTMMKNFGYNISTHKQGNSKNRTYIYKYERLEIIENYLSRLNNCNFNNIADIDM